MTSFKQILAVHGTPRSGTTWVGQIIDSSPEVRYKYQPLFSESFKDRIWVRSSKEDILRTFEEIYNKKDEFLDRKKQKHQGIHKRFSKKDSKPDYLAVKHVRYHYLIPHLLKTLNNILVIGIVRHPCGVLNSWRKAPREFLPQHDFRKNWRFAEDRTDFKPEEYYGFHKWKELTKMFLEMEKRFPNRFYLIRYENLVKYPLEESQKLFDFCNLFFSKQSEKFLNESITFFNDDIYSVYKGGKKVDDWKDEMDEDIIQTISEELEGTEFQRFLND
jgi:hypothetical protein